jgi:conserved oligomeric Golgi complex subunit 2
MIPPTPFIDGVLANNGPATASLPPRTPYTPFTAFVGKQNPFELMFGAQATSAAHLLDEEGDPLAALYNTLLRFVDRELVRIMDAAERICIKSGSRTRDETKRIAEGGDRSKAREESRGFDIMANVVWAEIGRTIMDELGSSIFASGKPDQFRKVGPNLASPKLNAHQLLSK